MRKLVICQESNPEDVPFIRKGLTEYNIKNLTEADATFVSEDFAFTVKDENGHILGGIAGNTKMQTVQIQFLWMDSSLRGQGYGTKLMKRIEEFAKEKNCRMVKVDTFSFQAPNFYKSLGYEVYGILEDYPEGYSQYFLFKKLS